MNADQFSLKARRTTRIPLRIPVLVVLEENGNSRSLDAWTMIVNIHGAKIECKRGIPLHKEVLIQVPFNGMSEKGKVVWSRPEPNEHGNYEIGVELDRAENLWGVGFPPSDWEATRSGKTTAPDVKLETQAGSPPMDLTPAPSSGQIPAEEVSEHRDILVAAPSPAVAPAAPTVIDHGLVDLREAAPDWTPGESNALTNENVNEFSSLQMSPLEEEIPMLSPEPAQKIKATEARAPSSVVSSQGLATLENLFAGKPAVAHPAPPRQPIGTGLESPPPSDRLSAIFDELVESALQTRVVGLVERVGQRIEARVTEMEAIALARVEQRIEASASSQCQSLEHRALDFVTSQQQLLEQNVQRFVESAEAKAQQRQQEFLEESRQAMRTEAADLATSCKNRLEQETDELVESTRASLRQTLEQQLPPMEKDMLERCRAQAERLLASQVEQWTLLFSDRLKEAQQTMNQQVDAAAEKAAARQVTALETRSEELLAQLHSRIEQQLAQIATQVRQSFLRHIVTELNKNQEVWIERAQRQLEDLAEQNLQWTRRNVSLVMKNFGEALLRQAYMEGASPAQVAPASAAGHETQSALNLTEAPVVSQDCT